MPLGFTSMSEVVFKLPVIVNALFKTCVFLVITFFTLTEYTPGRLFLLNANVAVVIVSFVVFNKNGFTLVPNLLSSHILSVGSKCVFNPVITSVAVSVCEAQEGITVSN